MFELQHHAEDTHCGNLTCIVKKIIEDIYCIEFWMAVAKLNMCWDGK
jgi:hypothetical protein